MGWGKKEISISVGEPQRPKTYSQLPGHPLSGPKFPHYNPVSTHQRNKDAKE